MNELPKVDQLLAERSALIERKYLVGLSRAEHGRLASLSWQLETVRGAELAPDLAKLEQVANAHQAVAAGIDRLLARHGGWRSKE